MRREAFEAEHLHREKFGQRTKIRPGRQMAFPCSAAGERGGEHRRAAGLQARTHARRQDRRAWQDDEFVAGKIRRGRNDVDIQAEFTQAGIERPAKIDGGAAAALRLDFVMPEARIIEHEGDIGRLEGDFAEFADLARHGADFVHHGLRRAVPAQEASMRLLLREGRLAPAEIADEAGAVREGFPGPETHHAGRGGRIVARPVHRAGLLFHDGPGRRGAAEGVVVEGGKIRMALMQPAGLLLRRESALAEQADGIAVPGGDIQMLADIVMVEADEVADEIVRDRTIRTMMAENCFLLDVEADHLVAVEAAEVEDVGGIGLGDRCAGKVDLVEAAIFLRPEDRTPGGVQRGHRAVARIKPTAEGGRCVRGKALVAAMVAELIVGLPHHDGGVLAIAAGQRLSDAGALAAIGLRGEAVMPAGAKTARAAMLVLRENLRIEVNQPFGRRGGRRAEDDAEALGVQGFNGAVEPTPVEAAGFRLQPRPGKLADPHEAQPQRAHHPGVFGPVGLRPVFGIVADAELHCGRISIQAAFLARAGMTWKENAANQAAYEH